MALTAALLGWMFDGFEMSLFPVIGQPALAELLPGPPAAVVNRWFGVVMAVFLVGAATGGVLFGWLGDKIGRVRAMSLSIFTYAVFTGLCGLVSEPWQLALFRFIASLGMGGEWSLGVALVMELWPDRSRAWLAGLIGAANNVGALLVGFVSLGLLAILDSVHRLLLAIGLPGPSVERLVSNQGWRLIMIVGALPAVLIFFIRLCVPESKKWEEEKASGATSHWAARDLLMVLIGCLGAAGVIYAWSPIVGSSAARVILTPLGIAAALVGYMHPVRRYLVRAQRSGHVPPGSLREQSRRLVLAAGLAGVAFLGTWGALQWAPRWAAELAGHSTAYAKEYTQICSATGAIVGTILAAVVAGRIGRRLTYALLCLGSFAAAILLYRANASFNAGFLISIFVTGSITAAFYGWFPLYLPELFPTSVRATSQGFAFNFGRIIAAIGVLQTASLMAMFDGSFPKAGSALSGIYLLGLVLIWFCPETKGKPLPD